MFSDGLAEEEKVCVKADRKSEESKNDKTRDIKLKVGGARGAPYLGKYYT